jgi:enoyl-CoA hydratase
MPETAIGLFPDVGATYVLPRLPNAIGMLMALTGWRLGGADIVRGGLATQFTPAARLPALRGALAAHGPGILGEFASPLPEASRLPPGPETAACFSARSVPDVLHRLQDLGTDWACDALAAARAASPAALCWTFESQRRGVEHTLAECLAAERALMRRVVRYPDFAEGVRALLIDKDRAPRWTPASIADIDPDWILSLFDPWREPCAETGRSASYNQGYKQP